MMKITKWLNISSYILAILITGVLVVSLFVAKHPHPECAFNDSVGPCEYWPLVWADFIAGTALTIYFWIIVNIIIVSAMLLVVGLSHILKKRS